MIHTRRNRLCVECLVPINDRHVNAIYCLKCSNERTLERKKEFVEGLSTGRYAPKRRGWRGRNANPMAELVGSALLDLIADKETSPIMRLFLGAGGKYLVDKYSPGPGPP